MYDPELYRTKAEVEEWSKRDPIPALIQRRRRGWPTQIDGNSKSKQLKLKSTAEVDDAVESRRCAKLAKTSRIYPRLFTSSETKNTETPP